MDVLFKKGMAAMKKILIIIACLAIVATTVFGSNAVLADDEGNAALVEADTNSENAEAGEINDAKESDAKEGVTGETLEEFDFTKDTMVYEDEDNPLLAYYISYPDSTPPPEVVEQWRKRGAGNISDENDPDPNPPLTFLDAIGDPVKLEKYRKQVFIDCTRLFHYETTEEFEAAFDLDAKKYAEEHPVSSHKDILTPIAYGQIEQEPSNVAYKENTTINTDGTLRQAIESMERAAQRSWEYIESLTKKSDKYYPRQWWNDLQYRGLRDDATFIYMEWASKVRSYGGIASVIW